MSNFKLVVALQNADAIGLEPINIGYRVSVYRLIEMDTADVMEIQHFDVSYFTLLSALRIANVTIEGFNDGSQN